MRIPAMLLSAVLTVLVAAPVTARTWKSRVGDFSVEATLVDIRHDAVVLKKTDGALVGVSLEKLSAEDVQYVEEVFDGAVQRIRDKSSPPSAPVDVERSSDGVRTSVDSSAASLRGFAMPSLANKPFEDGPVLPKVPPSGLRKRWQQNRGYPYVFEAKADLGKYVETVRGVVQIQAADRTVSRSLFSPKQSMAGTTGSAFVARPDGYLITSAQLVEHARQIRVRLGEKSHNARVFALNTRYDLALLRIPAMNLPVLPLAGPESSKVTDEVYAVGFSDPSSQASQSYMKRGALAGIIDRNGDQVLQMDAGFPAGLLGGPLVNRKGEVIGVASTDITAGAITDIGLAVPAHYARRIIENRGLLLLNRGHEQPMEQADLEDLVRRSVAAVSVTRSAPDTSSFTALSYDAYWLRYVRSKLGLGALPEAIEAFVVEDSECGHILVDEFGEVHTNTGRKELPYFMGKPGQLPLEAFSATGEFTWKESSLVHIKLVELRGHHKHFRPADIPVLPGFLKIETYRDPRLQMKQMTDGVHRGASATVHEILESRIDSVLISKRYDVQTFGLPDLPDFSRMVAKGTVLCDRATGILQKSETTAIITHHVETTDTKVSVSLTCQAASPGQWRQLAKQGDPLTVQMEAWRNEIQDAVRQAARTSPEASPDVVLDRILADIRAAKYDNWEKVMAVMSLGMMAPIDDRRVEVLDLIEPCSQSDRSTLKSRAVEAMAVWASERDLPRLVKLLDQPASSSHRKALQGLGKSRLPALAHELVERLRTSGKDRGFGGILWKMGPVAEAPLLEALEHKPPATQVSICSILSEVGGEASIAAIEKLLADGAEGDVASAARRYLEKLKEKLEEKRN